MKIAVLSDIHGNYNALQEVLRDLESTPVDHTICLGDCIGYGPEPEQVIQEIRRRGIPAVIGNHEMAVCNPIHLNWFNPLARQSLEKTITMLSPSSLDYIRNLPTYILLSGYRFVHGFPPNSPQVYLFQKSAAELRQAFEAMTETICFVGHTHDLEIIRYDGRQVDRGPLSAGSTALKPGSRFIVNVGSVGQPRDGTHHAKYAIWDEDKSAVEIRFISYDIASTAAKITAAGLPQRHADRLW